MDKKYYQAKADEYLYRICNVKPNRHTGSQGNRDATAYCADILQKLGYTVDTKPFHTLDYKFKSVTLTLGNKRFQVYQSPYSLSCHIKSELVNVSTVTDLENIDCNNKILLMKGEICSKQLMPKNFVFYNPDEHKKIINLLEEKNPAAIITATSKNPDLVGALYPFPLIVDGDFNIPSVYCTDFTGEEISAYSGEQFELDLQAERIPSTAWNVIGLPDKSYEEKIIFCAHIDAYEDSPGASDNSSGVVVLLLLAEMLLQYKKPIGVELIAFNGEDHYSAGGQMDYLKRYGTDIKNIRFAVNIDDVGFKDGKTDFSFYEVDNKLQQKISTVLNNYPGLKEGESWFSGDHMIFVQQGRPAIALTSEKMPKLMATITHTKKDKPEIIDTLKLVEIAEALSMIVQ
ncbi:MAG: M28 family peptidase [Atribacterota bacterium]|nr:M28 family peptidase [Atribacterota bacterium]MDD5637815.1 M28 family peptidase [Atribacterota bacterium]